MAASLVSVLVDEVADLLRHDNLDTRVQTWLRMAFNDMASRMPVWRFFEWAHTAAISLGTLGYATLPTNGGSEGVDPVGAIVFDNTGKIWTPRYVPYLEMRRWNRNLSLDALPTGDGPLVWTIGPYPKEGTSTDAGRNNVFWYPVSSAATWYMSLLGRINREPTDLALTTRYRVPYHMEHALVWGASYFGAKFLRPQIAEVYLAEYEQAIRNLTWVLTFKPDATPIMRSLGAPYEGTSRLSTMPRIPSNIPAS